MTTDLRQFYGDFFTETLELLDRFEHILVESPTKAFTPDLIHELFRIIHSIKGNSGTLKFQAIAKFSHQLESFLNMLQQEHRHISEDIRSLLLRANDSLRRQIERLQQDTEHDALLSDDRVIFDMLQKYIHDSHQSNQHSHLFQIRFMPERNFFLRAHDPLQVVKKLGQKGELIVKAIVDDVPKFSDINPRQCYLSWNMILETTLSKKELLRKFDWMLDDNEFQVSTYQATTSPSQEMHPSVRVSTEKIDILANHVGELIVIQSMIQAIAENFSDDKLENLRQAVDLLMTNTRDLREDVLKIRMLPMSVIFNRFPRFIHDIALQTGKKIQLRLQGEKTELDKSLLEKIADPLTQLIRNAMMHGLEEPEQRLAAGKPAAGTITLYAHYESSGIVIEVSDDGYGLSEEKIRQAAIQQGLLTEDAALATSDCYQLIFKPGFSTANEITELSGRGIGLDIVHNTISEIGGTIDIDTQLGQGTKFIIRLPLTLTIIEGQLIKVGEQIFIMPLLAMIESLEFDPDLLVDTHEAASMYPFHEKFIPIIWLRKKFQLAAEKYRDDFLIIVDIQGREVGFVIDDLMSQQQVVVKDFSKNYQKIAGLSGATILGNGDVAFIIDVFKIAHFFQSMTVFDYNDSAGVA